MLADSQALTDNYDNPEKVRYNVIEVIVDYLSIRLDPNIVTFFIQSELQTELTFYYLNLGTISRLERNPTVKSEMQKRGFNDGSLPVGFYTYPISQATDITAFDANIVPVGEEQKPMIEQKREIVQRFNYIYG